MCISCVAGAVGDDHPDGLPAKCGEVIGHGRARRQREHRNKNEPLENLGHTVTF